MIGKLRADSGTTHARKVRTTRRPGGNSMSCSREVAGDTTRAFLSLQPMTKTQERETKEDMKDGETGC
jgi:hypothetical protein